MHVLGLDSPIGGNGTGPTLKKKMKYDTDVEAIATLARLSFSPQEMSGIEEEMNRIIEFADKLSTADTTGIDAEEHIVPMKNVFREDVVENAFTAEELLEAAGAKHDGYIVVPRAFEEGKEA